MKLKQLLFNKKLLTGLALMIIMLGATWVRTYNFHDWLFFKLDQARETILLAPAIENGPENLPLHGPRATKVGGDYLRLGPAFYYFMYLSGILFNSIEPDVFAYPDLFFSILTIPLLFFFLRLYFSRAHSLLSTLLYSFSFLVIQYSRFAWNPNSVPFFELLSFYGLLRFTNSNKFKPRLGWISLWAVSFAIATQLHFFAFFTITAITAVFLIIRYNLWKIHKVLTIIKQLFSRQSMAFVMISIIIIGFFYTPMIISDVITNGSNVKNFVGAFSEKPKQGKTAWQKVVRNLREQPKYYYLLITSFRHRKGMKADPIPVGMGTTFIVLGLGLAIHLRRKEKDQIKKDFLMLSVIWTILFFIITIPTSYQLRPRFFVVVFAIPYIFFGLWFVFFSQLFKKRSWSIIFTITVSVLLLNSYGIYAWFKEQELSQIKGFEVGRTYILQRQDGITLGQLERGVDFIYQNRENNSLVFFSDAEYRNPISYLLNLKKDPSLNYQVASEPKDFREHNIIFAFNNTKGGTKSLSKKVKEHGTIMETHEFGQLTVYVVKINQESLPEPKATNMTSKNESGGKTERLFWRDVFK